MNGDLYLSDDRFIGIRQLDLVQTDHRPMLIILEFFPIVFINISPYCIEEITIFSHCGGIDLISISTNK